MDLIDRGSECFAAWAGGNIAIERHAAVCMDDKHMAHHRPGPIVWDLFFSSACKHMHADAKQ